MEIRERVKVVTPGLKERSSAEFLKEKFGGEIEEEIWSIFMFLAVRWSEKSINLGKIQRSGPN